MLLRGARLFLSGLAVLIALGYPSPSQAHMEVSALKAVSDGDTVGEPVNTNTLYMSRQVRQAIRGKAKTREGCLNPDCNGFCYGDCECDSTCIGSKCTNGYFGVMCTKLCNCSGLPCDISTGNCSVMGDRCPPGKKLVSRGQGTSECTDCPEGTHGINCTGICNPCTDVRFPNCSRSNGQCICAGCTVDLLTSPTAPSTAPPGEGEDEDPSAEASSSSQQTIIIAASVAVIILLVIFITVICVVLRRLNRMSGTQETHVHVHDVNGSYNDLTGKNGGWATSPDREYTLPVQQELPTYTPLLKMPGSPPPAVPKSPGTRPPQTKPPLPLAPRPNLGQLDDGAAYAHTTVTQTHEEPCYRILELEPIKDIPPPVASKPGHAENPDHHAMMGYAQLGKDKPLSHASRSLSTGALSEGARKKRSMRPSQTKPLSPGDGKGSPSEQAASLASTRKPGGNNYIEQDL